MPNTHYHHDMHVTCLIILFHALPTANCCDGLLPDSLCQHCASSGQSDTPPQDTPSSMLETTELSLPYP